MNTQAIKLFWLGLFLIVGLALMSWLLLFLRPSYGDGGKEIRVRFTNVEKVSVGTRVTYAGRAVGTVVEINEIFDAREGPTDAEGDYYFYELVLRVDSSVTLFNSDQIIFTTTGLLGERSVAILPKAPKPGQKALEIAQNTTLYANTSENFEQSISHFGNTLTTFDDFLLENRQEFHQALVSVTRAADEMSLFLVSANKQQLAEKAATAFGAMTTVLEQIKESDLIHTLSNSASHFNQLGERINQNGGTLHRLIESDELYCQLHTTICEMRRLICDINNYGLLFQYNRKWQRNRLLQKQSCME